MDDGDPRARLQALIDADGVSLTALSRMLQRNDAYVQQYVKRGTPRVLPERDRALLAAYFRIDEAELGGPARPRMAAIRRIDMEASAGPGAIGGDDPSAAPMLLDPRLVETLGLDPAHAAMLRARGDSMEPTIADGDQIVVDERDRRVTGIPAIFVLRLDGALLVKRLSRAGQGIRVASDNAAYPAFETDGAEIIGRVVWLSRVLR